MGRTAVLLYVPFQRLAGGVPAPIPVQDSTLFHGAPHKTCLFDPMLLTLSECSEYKNIKKGWGVENIAKELNERNTYLK